MAQLGCSVARLECSVAEKGCIMAHLVVRWPAVKQARVQILAWHPKEVFILLSEEAMKKKERGSANGYKLMDV